VEIAARIRRIGAEGIVNSYLVEEAGQVTIVDAGMGGQYADLPAELSAMGRSLADVRALLLTHGHSDHIGYAERLRADRSVPVWVHEDDAALARGEVPNPSKGLGRVRAGPLLRFGWYAATHGGLRTTHLGEVSTFGDGATLEVPGSPRVILTPGHTPGSAVLEFGSLGALMVGDALATYAVTTGEHGPRIAPFTADPAGALESLARLEDRPADLLLPGHGEPWTGGAAEAVRLVRSRAAA
jgi:glyoxylase-like metal-dependent hydrolase (beta-lactamase superfamily II)